MLLGVCLAGCASAQLPAGGAGGYSGPGVLSRNASGIGRRGGQLANLRFFAQAQANYDNGFVPLQVDENGQIANLGTLVGAEISVGLYGGKSWRRTVVGVDYSGTYARYNSNSSFNGFIQSLTLGVAHQFNRQWAIDTQLSAGTTNRGIGFFGGAAGTGAIGSPLIGGPTTFVFDNRTYFLQNSTTAVYQFNPRWSISMGGSGFTVQRVSKALADVNGYSVQAQLGYRLSRNTQIGGGYHFMHFDFPNAFGEADVHGFSGSYRRTLGRRWNLDLQAGLARARTIGLQTASLDPAIAALLGQDSVIRVFDRTVTLSSFRANLAGKFQRYGVSVGYDRSVMPGNGIFLTSLAETGTGGFNYQGSRRLSLTASGNYGRITSLGAGFNPIAQGLFGGGMNYRLFRSLHASSRYDLRRVLTDQAAFRRTSQRLSFGLAFSPGDIPLSLW